jgi:hypothetical protein
MPFTRRIRGCDVQLHATLAIDAPWDQAERIAHEFLNQVEAAEPPEGWRKTWPEIKVIKLAPHLESLPGSRSGRPS